MKIARLKLNIFKNLSLFVIGVFQLQSCIDLPCPTGGEDQCCDANENHQFVINYDGRLVGELEEIKLPIQYRYLQESSLLTSDYSFIKMFGKWQTLTASNYFAYNNKLDYNFIKTMYFDDTYAENWNLLSDGIKFYYDKIMDVRSPYETCLIYSDSLVNITNNFSGDTTKVQINRGKVHQYNVESSNRKVLIKEFQSGFISVNTYMDTTLTDMKIKNDSTSLVVLTVSEFRLSSDSLSVETKYAMVKQEIVISSLSNNGLQKTVFKQLNTSGADWISPKIRFQSDYIILKSFENETDQYLILDEDYNVLDGDLMGSNGYIPVLAQKGRSMILAKDAQYARSRSFLLRNEFGQKQNLSEVIHEADSTVDYATIYDNRYVVYLSNHFKTISLYDIVDNKLRLSLNIDDTNFKVKSNAIFRYEPYRIIPLIYIDDIHIQLMIEYFEYELNPDGC